MHIRDAHPSTPAPARRAWRRRPLWLVTVAAGAVLFTGSVAVAASTVVARGQGDMVNPALTNDLQVTASLEPMLVPGGTSNVTLRVRNRGGKAVTLDRVVLKRPLRAVKPVGCSARLSGPLLPTAGMALPSALRVTVQPGQVVQVTIPAALKLSSAATSGCGFTVAVEVQAVAPATGPTITPATTRPTTPATTAPTTRPTTPATTEPPSPESN